MAVTSTGLGQTCYDGTETSGTPEELISTYFMRQSNYKHVHPMANSPFQFVAQVSRKS